MLKSFLFKNIALVSKHNVFLIFSLIFLFNLWSLMRFPAPFMDEVWLISRAWTYLQTGYNFGQLDQGILETFDGHWTFLPFIQTWIYAVGLKIAGDPILLPLRLITLGFSMLLLVSMFFIGKNLGNKREALITVILIALTQKFIGVAHLARADIIVSALGFSVIAIYLKNKTSRWELDFLSGFLLGIIFEIHPNSMIYIPVLGVFYFLDGGWSVFKRKSFWVFLSGLTLGLGIYLILHVFPYPKTYFALADLFGGVARRPPLLTFGRLIKGVFEQHPQKDQQEQNMFWDKGKHVI